ncbi:AzlD domain-containing protein [Gorillibacterium sp. sgz5001074]|uniref:AzlD domain-containing protein n=1 Tax=Gorillibacterium sp. sgz5001074 TaxID=3446695 RepID=UPI003F66A95D
MEVRGDVLLIILASALVTLLPRVVPLALLSRVELPEWSLRWLQHIPVAVMSALLAQALFIRDGTPAWQPLMVLPAIPAWLVAVRTRSLLLTVVAGIAAAMALVRLL